MPRRRCKHRPVHVIIEDTEQGLAVTDVKGANPGLMLRVWDLVQKYLAYTPSGEPTVSGAFLHERPPELGIDTIILHLPVA